MEKRKKRSMKTSKSQPKSSSTRHKNSLEKLRSDDPEFYEFLKGEDRDLLRFEDDSIEESEDKCSEATCDTDDSDDDSGDDDDTKKNEAIDEDEEAEVNKIVRDLEGSDSDEDPVHRPPDKLEEFELPSDASEDEHEDDEKLEDQDAVKSEPKAEESKLLSGRVTLPIVKRWSKLLKEKPTPSLLHDVAQGFKIAVARASIGGRKTNDSMDSVKDATVLNAVTRLCLGQILPAFTTLLGLPRKSTRLDRPSLLTQSKGWKRIRTDVKSYLGDILKMLTDVSQPQTADVLLRHILNLSTFYSCFPVMSRNLLKRLVNHWSAGEDTTRVVAFLCINRLVRLQADNLLDPAIKKMYIAYVRNTKFTSPSTLPFINFMQRTLVELLAVDTSVTYRYAFVYIRQLAIHLRNAIVNHKSEHVALVYNWQYIHSLALWVRLLGELCPGDSLDPLIYPLTQTIIGVIKLVPTQKFYPLRFHCIRALTHLSASTHTYIPVLPFILEVFEQTDFNRRHKNISLHTFTFATTLKFSKSQITEKAFKDGVIDQLYEVLLEFLNVHSHNIAFPELALPAVIQLKDFLKKCKVANYCKQMKQIVDKIQESSQFLIDRRKTVTFSVSDSEAIEAWQRQVQQEGTPLGKYYVAWRKRRDHELQNEISGKDRMLDSVDIPTVDRSKFKRKATDEDRKEFAALFEDDSEEDDTTRFLLKEERPAKVAKKQKNEQPDASDQYSDLDSDEMEQLAGSASEDDDDDDESDDGNESDDNESDREDNEVQEKRSKDRITTERAKKLRDDSVGEEDIVEDLNLSSSSDED